MNKGRERSSGTPCLHHAHEAYETYEAYQALTAMKHVETASGKIVCLAFVIIIIIDLDVFRRQPLEIRLCVLVPLQG